jgi:hypothetical protein
VQKVESIVEQAASQMQVQASEQLLAVAQIEASVKSASIEAKSWAKTAEDAAERARATAGISMPNELHTVGVNTVVQDLLGIMEERFATVTEQIARQQEDNDNVCSAVRNELIEMNSRLFHSLEERICSQGDNLMRMHEVLGVVTAAAQPHFDASFDNRKCDRKCERNDSDGVCIGGGPEANTKQPAATGCEATLNLSSCSVSLGTGCYSPEEGKLREWMQQHSTEGFAVNGDKVARSLTHLVDGRSSDSFATDLQEHDGVAFQIGKIIERHCDRPLHERGRQLHGPEPSEFPDLPTMMSPYRPKNHSRDILPRSGSAPVITSWSPIMRGARDESATVQPKWARCKTPPGRNSPEESTTRSPAPAASPKSPYASPKSQGPVASPKSPGPEPIRMEKRKQSGQPKASRP